MNGISLALMIQAAVVAAPDNTYKTAYKQHTEQGRPLVVLVGAEWCPGCRTMKHSVVPQLVENGALKDVAFAIVDTDKQPELARKLMRGGSIPQLIVFHESPEGMQREGFVGAQSVSTVENVIDRAVTEAAESVAQKTDAEATPTTQGD